MPQSPLKDYLVDVVTGKRSGAAVIPVLFLLTVLEWVYRVLLKLNRWFTKKERLPVPVISIGNLLTGGTGKTPATVAVAKFLSSEGLKPAVLTRGYGGNLQENGGIFLHEDLEGLKPEVTGDEPYLMAELLPGTPIVVGRDRASMAKRALALHPEIDCFLLDDGLQYWKLERDLDIVMIDLVNPFGNGHLLPRGLLREPLTALKRAGLVFFTRSGQVDKKRREQILTRVRRFNPGVPMTILESRNSVYTPLSGKTGGREPAPGDRAAVLTAIGNPGQFQTAVSKTGVLIEYFQSFPDHHLWSKEEIETVVRTLMEKNLKILIVTGKDGVKLKRFAPIFQAAAVGCYVLNLDFLINDRAILEKIKEIAAKKGD